MILCRDMTDVSRGVVGARGGCHPRRDIRKREGRTGQDKYKRARISDRA